MEKPEFNTAADDKYKFACEMKIYLFARKEKNRKCDVGSKPSVVSKTGLKISSKSLNLYSFKYNKWIRRSHVMLSSHQP